MLVTDDCGADACPHASISKWTGGSRLAFRDPPAQFGDRAAAIHGEIHFAPKNVRQAAVEQDSH